MKKKSIFSATSEESKKVVKKKILTSDGAGIGDASSMKIGKKLSLFLLFTFFFGILFIGLGIGMPAGFLEAKPEKIIVIPFQGILLIGRIGVFLKPIVIASIVFLLLMLTINLFPKKNYARQLLTGYLIVFSMVVCCFFCMSPLVIGLTIDGTGYLGFLVQLTVGVYLIVKITRNRIVEYQHILLGNKEDNKILIKY